MDRKQHWEQVYTTKKSDAVSWFQEHADHSLRLIHNTGLGKDAAIIDVGGGASILVDDLVAEAIPTSPCWIYPPRHWLSQSSGWGCMPMRCVGWKETSPPSNCHCNGLISGTTVPFSIS